MGSATRLWCPPLHRQLLLLRCTWFPRSSMFRSLDPGAELLAHSRFWGPLGIGYASEILVVLVLLLARLLYPLGLDRTTFPMEVTWLTPAVPWKAAPAPPPAIQTTTKAKPLILHTASDPKLQLPAVEAPPVLAAKAESTLALPSTPSRVPTLAPQPKLGTFATQQPSTTRGLPPSKVQTGGFGDPNGLPGTGPGTGRLIAGRVGAFDLPKGEGYGNGTGGSTGTRGRVANS